ncbi:MAG: DUF6263 family protein [Planctomycetota bacterium]
MKLLNAMLMLAVCAAMLLWTPAATAKDVRLAVTPKAGTSYKYEVDISSEQVAKTPMGDQGQTLGQMLELTLTWEEVSGDGSATAIIVFDRVRLEADGMQVAGSFDSAQPAGQDGNNPLAVVGRSVIGKPFTFKIAEDGEITDVSGSDPLKPSAMIPAMLFQQLFSGESLSESMLPLFRVKKAPSVASQGDTWTIVNERDMDGMGAKFVNSTDYTLERVSGDKASISLTGKIEIRNAPGTPNNPQQLKIKDSSYKGNCEWNVKDGVLQAYNSDMSFVGEAGQAPMLIEVEVTATGAFKRVK